MHIEQSWRAPWLRTYRARFGKDCPHQAQAAAQPKAGKGKR